LFIIIILLQFISQCFAMPLMFKDVARYNQIIYTMYILARENHRRRIKFRHGYVMNNPAPESPASRVDSCPFPTFRAWKLCTLAVGMMF